MNELKEKQIKGLSLKGLQNLLLSEGEAKYRATQLFNWMYNHRVTDFALMENIPKSLRAKLKEKYELLTLEVTGIRQSSVDGTVKLLFRTRAGHAIESVIIPDEERTTLCISTQVGCPLDCKFCATGLMGYKKNLTSGEIFDQFLLAQKNYELPISNIVYMGMGEPLLNFENTVRSLEIFGNELTKGISLKKVTVSTAGIPHKIKELADTGLKPKLAFSLHSPFEKIRSQIMPINDKYSLKENLLAIEYYLHKTDSRITFEYVLLKGINDREEDLKALVKLCRRMPSKMNIIPFNSLKHMAPTGFSAELEPSPWNRIEEFASELRDANITVMLRDTKGEDIAAACGQLAVKHQ